MTKEPEKTTEFKSEADNIRYLAMEDCARNCLIALPIIMIFESYMLLSWILHRRYSSPYIGYPICYAVLLAASAIVIAITLYVRKDLVKRYRFLLMTQNFYAVLFILWALGITWLDAISNNFLSVIVFMTIAILVPVMCYITPILWMLVYFGSGIVILSIAPAYRPHLVGFITNFVIFLIMGYVTQWAYYTARKHSYIRQIELTKLAETNFQYAYVDSLTGLYNRRSYTERMDELEKAPSLPDRLVIVSFDVNGLKSTNDRLGHLAGDELLVNAGKCIREAFSSYGTLYRTGGDEFMAILSCTKNELREASSCFVRAIDTQNYQTNSQIRLSISYGTAAACDYTDKSLGELSKIADDAMYLSKQQYYSASGVERRRYRHPTPTQ